MLLAQPNRVSQPLNQVPQDFSLAGDKVKTEDSAVALVVQNTARAEKFITARLWMSEWRVAKALYEAPVKQDYWRDTTVPRASNSYPLCAQHVRAILDTTIPALFPEWPPFAIEPNEGTPRQVSRAWETILTYQLRQVGFKPQIRLIAKDAEIFGTGIGKWGWETYTVQRTRYFRSAQPQKIKSLIPGGKDTVVHTEESDTLDAQDFEEKISKPFFKRCEINHVLVSPGLREPDIRHASYVIYRDYLTIRDLNKLREFEGYNIPSEPELIALAAPPAEHAGSSAIEAESTAYPAQGHRPLPRYLDESEDPLEHKLEVLEQWTKNNVIVVLQRKVAIRNERNKFAQVPFVSCFWDDIPGTFYAFGIPRRIGSMQTHIQGLRNLRLDDVNLNLQNVWLEKQGTNLTGQPLKFYPGARMKVSDPEGIKPMIKQPILQEAYKEEAILVADAEKTTGANEQLVQGAQPAAGGRSSMGRTAGGAALMGGASSARIQGFVDVIAEQVFIPVLYAFLHMDREYLEPKLMRKIIGKTLWEALEESHDGDLLLDVCDGAYDVQFTMLAGTSIAAKQKMAAALPMEMQIYSTPATQQGLADGGYKVNWIELSRRMEQTTGWKSQEDIIIPLTDEDIQRKAESNPEMVKGKMTLARIAQLHRGDMEKGEQGHQHRIAEIDAKGIGKVGENVLTRSLERAELHEELPQISGKF